LSPRRLNVLDSLVIVRKEIQIQVGKSESPEVRGSRLKVLERNSPGRKYNESQEDQKRIQVK